MKFQENISCDVLVIGGGVAGCFAAIAAKQKGADVLVLDKGSAGRAGASIMASGFWAVYNEDWGMDLDVTLDWINKNSSYLNNREWTQTLLEDSWGTYQDLLAWGIPFPVPQDQVRTFFRENLTVDPDDPLSHYGIVPLTHRALPPALRRYAQGVGVRFLDRVMVTDLIVKDKNAVGAVAFSLEDGTLYQIVSGAVVMTAGKNAFKPPGMHVSGQTGDADAIAYRAGAMLSGKEFPDMHINIAKHPEWKGNGEMYPPYFKFYDSNGRLIPNQGFDLSLVSSIHAGEGPIIWDFDKATDAEMDAIHAYLKKRNNLKETQRVGLNPDKRGKWRMIGGAAAGGPGEQSSGLWLTDLYGSTTVSGLYAAGDCAATWGFGATIQGPPPGLMPAGVTGKRAGNAAADYAMGCKRVSVGDSDFSHLKHHALGYLERPTGYDPRWVTQLLQNTMMPWYVLHIKQDDRLRAALTFVDFIRGHMVPKMCADDPHTLRLAHEAENMALNAEMILRVSLMREESRGWHYREDFPEPDDKNWLAWIRMRCAPEGMRMDKENIPNAWRPPAGYAHPRPWLAWEHPTN